MNDKIGGRVKRHAKFTDFEPMRQELLKLRDVVRLYLKTYADTQTHPTPAQEAEVINAARAALGEQA